MDRAEVEDLVGKEDMIVFDWFMRGQTVGLVNGKVDYYPGDVNKFIRQQSYWKARFEKERRS